MITDKKDENVKLVFKYSLRRKLVTSFPLLFLLIGSMIGIYVGLTVVEIGPLLAGLLFLALVTYMFIDLYTLELVIDKGILTKRNLVYSKDIRIVDIEYCEEVLVGMGHSAKIEYIFRSRNPNTPDIKIRYPRYFSNNTSFERWIDDNLRRKKLPFKIQPSMFDSQSSFNKTD